jgi:hypothetical protein
MAFALKRAALQRQNSEFRVGDNTVLITVLAANAWPAPE